MVSESLALVLCPLRHAPVCCNLVSRLPFAGNGIGFFGVSCKMRKQNLRLRRKCQQSKKMSSKCLLLNMKFQPPDDENEEVQTVTKDDTMDTLPSSIVDASFSTKTDDTVATTEENIIPTEEGQQFRNVHLEDLIGIIRNAEKNILLLNQARVRALEDVEKILSEKEALQEKVNILEVKLAETDAQIRDAALEKEKVEALESQLERLKKEMCSRNSGEGGNNGAYETVDTLEVCLGKQMHQKFILASLNIMTNNCKSE